MVYIKDPVGSKSAVNERPAPRFRNDSTGRTKAVRPRFKPKRQPPKIGALYDAPYVPLGTDPVSRHFLAPTTARQKYGILPTLGLGPTTERPAPTEGVMQAPDFLFEDFQPKNRKPPKISDSSAYAGAAYLEYLKQLRQRAEKLDFDAAKWNAFRHPSKPPQTTENLAKFDRYIDQNDILKRMFKDPTHGKDLVATAVEMGIPLPNDAINHYTKEITDAIKNGAMAPEEIPNIVLTSNFKPAILVIQAKLKALHYSDQEIHDMNYGQMVAATIGRKKYSVVGHGFGSRGIPTFIRNTIPDFASNVIAGPPSMAIMFGGAAVRDINDELHGRQPYPWEDLRGRKKDSTLFGGKHSRELTKGFAQQQAEYFRNLYERPGGTLEAYPVSTSLLGWSLLHGGAGALGRIPKFARDFRLRAVELGNMRNRGEAGIELSGPLPEQRGVPRPNMPPDQGPTPGIDAPMGGPGAGPPSVVRGPQIGPAEPRRISAAGKPVFDAPRAKADFKKRTGRPMTKTEVEAARHRFNVQVGNTPLLEGPTRLTHDEALHQADLIQQHIEQQHAEIAAREAAQKREDDLMRGLPARGVVDRATERITNLRTLRDERNQLAADIYHQESQLNLPESIASIDNQIEAHGAEISKLNAAIDRGTSPGLEPSMHAKIKVHDQAIQSLEQQKADFKNAGRIAQDHIAGMKRQLSELDSHLLTEHIATNVYHPSIERRIPELQQELQAAQRRQAPAHELKAIKTKLDAARTIGTTEPYAHFLDITRQMGDEWFNQQPTRRTPLVTHGLSPLEVALRAYEEKGVVEGAGNPLGEYLHEKAHGAIEDLVNTIYTGRRSSGARSYYESFAENAAKDVWGDNWKQEVLHAPGDKVTRADQLKMIDFLQRVQDAIVRHHRAQSDIRLTVRDVNLPEGDPGILGDLTEQRYVAGEHKTEAAKAHADEISRVKRLGDTASIRSVFETPPEIADLRRQGGRVTSREGNVVRAHFSQQDRTRDPTGLRNPKIDTPEKFNHVIRNLNEVKDDPETLLHIENRLDDMEQRRNDLLSNLLEKVTRRGSPSGNLYNDMTELEKSAFDKAQLENYMLDRTLNTVADMRWDYAQRNPHVETEPGYLPVSKRGVYTPHPVQVGRKSYFHGSSGKRVVTIDNADPYFTRLDNLLGPGIYVSDFIDEAQAYAQTMHEDGSRALWEFKINNDHTNFIDMEEPLTGKARDIIRDFTRQWDQYHSEDTGFTPRLANAVDDMIRADMPGMAIYQEIAESIRRAYGRGRDNPARGTWGISDATQDHPMKFGWVHKLRKDLMDAGYDGYQHSGSGAFGAGQRHQVLVLFDPGKSVERIYKADDINAPHNAPLREDAAQRAAAREAARADQEAIAETERQKYLPVPRGPTDVIPHPTEYGKRAAPEVPVEVSTTTPNETQAAKLIHGDNPPEQIAAGGGDLEKARTLTGEGIRNLDDPLIVLRPAYSVNLIDRAIEWIDDKLLESQNPNLKWYQDHFLRNRYATEQGHVRRAFYMWREDLGPLLKAATDLTTEESTAVVGALAQGVTIDQMKRFFKKLIDIQQHALDIQHFPEVLREEIEKSVPTDKTLAKVQRIAENTPGFEEHARAIRDFRRKMKEHDYIDDGLFGAFVTSWYDTSLDLRKQHEMWSNIHKKLGDEPNTRMTHLVDEMRKASKGVEQLLEDEGILPRKIMDERRYQRQRIVSSVLGEEIPLDPHAVYVPDRATLVQGGEHLMRRSRRYDPGGVFAGRLKKHKGRLLVQGKVNPSFGAYYTNLTSAKSKVAAIHLQEHILRSYAHPVMQDQKTYDRARFTPYDGRLGRKYENLNVRSLLDEINNTIADEAQQYGLADLGNRQDIPGRSQQMPLNKIRDVRDFTPEELRTVQRGDMFLVPNALMEAIDGQVTKRMPKGQFLRSVQKITNWWKTLVLKLRPAYLPVNVFESASRAGLYGGVGPISYARSAKINERFLDMVDRKTGKTYRELGIDPIDTLIPEHIKRTTFTGDITTKYHHTIAPGFLAKERRQFHDTRTRVSRKIRDDVILGDEALEAGRFVLGGYGKYIFEWTAQGENAMRKAMIVKRMLQEARNQKYAGKFWHPGRYTDKLDENMMQVMQDIREGKDVTKGAAMEEIMRDTGRLLGDFSKAHSAALGIVFPFYRWVGFITRFTLMEAMFRRPGRAYLYGQISKMSWVQLQQLGLLPANIAGAIPLALDQAANVDPATAQKDKLLTVLYSQAWNGPATLINMAGIDPGTGESHIFEGGLKQLNPMAQMLFGITALRDPASLREYRDAHGNLLSHFDPLVYPRMAAALFMRQLWPAMLGQDYSEMADTSIPYFDDIYKTNKSPLGQPQSSTGEKWFAALTGLRRRQLDLTKLQLNNLHRMQDELAAYDTSLGTRENPHNSAAQLAFRKEFLINMKDMAKFLDEWWKLHHTDPFEGGIGPAGTQIPQPPIIPPSNTGPSDEEIFNQQNQ